MTFLPSDSIPPLLTADLSATLSNAAFLHKGDQMLSLSLRMVLSSPLLLLLFMPCLVLAPLFGRHRPPEAAQ